MSACKLESLGRWLGCVALAACLGACATTGSNVAGPTRNQVIISVRDQKLTVIKEDHTRVTFPISTSKFGLGDRSRSYETPTGEMAVAAKIGGGAPAGAVFHGRVTTGEIVKVDAPGRDAIVSRILTLKGLEAGNAKAFSRGIYIHGTPEERNIGRPTSYGCIRMRSRDVIALYDMVKVGARVQIIDTTMARALAANVLPPTEAPPSPAVPSKIAPPSITPAASAPAPPAGATQVASIGKFAPPPQGAAVVKPSTAAEPQKGWAGNPANMIARANAAEARAKKAHPNNPPTPIENNPNGAPDNGYGAHTLSRSAIDSL